MKTHRRIISAMMVLMMFVSVLSVFSVIVAGAEQGSSTITITMSDSYGDGWNGNGIDVYVNGVNGERYTVSSGSSATHSISYDSANTYEFKWVKGSYSSECSFTIKLDGEILLSATQTQCGNYSNNYSLLTIDGVQEDIQYDLEGEFAGGTGTTSDPYLVATKAQLNNVRYHGGSHFRQVRNIVFTPSDFGASGDFYNDGHGWEPIGDNSDYFTGSYDGNGYTIDGLTITTDRSKYIYVGLFGTTYGDIVNVKLTNIYYRVSGGSYIGGIVGSANSNEIIGCSVSGEIYANDENINMGMIGGIACYADKVEHCESNVYIEAVGEYCVGGIVAAASGSIRYCKNNGNITVDGSADAYINAGGIVGNTGYIGSSHVVSDCQNNGNITIGGESDIYVLVGGIAGNVNCNIERCENNGTLSSSGSTVFIGGIAGEIVSYSNYLITVSECVNRANVSAVYPTERGYVGGIVGELGQNSIKNCYVTAVTLTSAGDSTSVAGGIAGHMYNDSYITNCYSIVNTVNVNSYAASGWGRGGIVGHNYGTVEKSYYRYTYGAGYNGGSFSATRYSNLSSYTSSSTYSGFDFSSVWKMDTGTYGYAVLRMESGHTHSLSYNAATVTYDTAGNLESWYCSGCQNYFRNSSGTRYVATDMLKSDPIPREGKCGTELSWKMTNAGELTIYGSGKMTDYTDSNPAPWYEYREKVKHITVEQGVTSLGSNAFKGCVNLTKITLADSIETIGDSTFSGCSNITRLRIPENIISVGDEAFSSISNLIIGFEGSAPYFGGSGVFSNTSATVYYPNYDTTWTATVMQGQTSSITWTPYTTIDDIIIASGSFSGANYGRIYWSFSLSGRLTVTGEYSSIELPDYNYSKRPAWESYKDDITSVEIVKISRIGNYTFDNYQALKSINFGSVNEVGSNAFQNCIALESVFLEGYSGGVTIEQYAFNNCSSLRQVAFPKDTIIEDYAFSGCSKLDSIYITKYINYVYGTPISPSSNSFYGVTATVYMSINQSYLKDYGDFGGNLTWKAATCGPCGSDSFWTYDANTSTITIVGTGSIASYHSGSQYTWYGLSSNVTKVVFEDGITYIPSYAFEYMSEIQTVTLPNTLQTLYCNTFNNCKSLNNLIIPASVTAFGYVYFNRCDSLTDVYYMGTAEEWSNITNNTIGGNSYDNVSNIHYLVLTEQEATCTTAGTETYYQFDDTSVYSGYYNLDKHSIAHPEVIQALGHDYETKWTTDVDPTCTTVGSKSRHCSRCDDKTDVTEIPANGHSYGDWNEIEAPTCTESGTAEHECLLCHYKELRTTDSKGHTNAEAVVENTFDATCTEDGNYDLVVYCSVCNAEISRETKTVDVLGHTAGAAADCENDQTCTVCGIVLAEKLGHSYNATVTTPTCTEAGYTTYTCHCGDTYLSDAFDALGHNYNAVVTAPTCITDGYTTHTCRRCDDSYVDSFVDALGHTEVVDAAVDPTCTETGLTKGKHCSVCNKVLVTQTVVDALGHTTGETVVENNVAPDCTNTGSYDNVVYCTVCDTELSRETVTVNALGHTEVIDVAVDPTCTETGLTEGKHCSVCNKVLVAQTVVDALDHTAGETVVENNVAPDCTNTGSYDNVVYCTVCQEELSRETVTVNALGHTEVVDAAVDPTCTETGLTKGKHCSVCNEVLVAQTVVDALGHTAGETVVENNVAPDCTNTGSYDNVVYCTVCQEELSRETVTVNALGHTEVVDVAVAPTCTTAGLTEGKHCSVCNKVLVAQTVVDELGHTEGMIEVVPSCTMTGLTGGRYCLVCHVIIIEPVVVDARGHSFTYYTSNSDATCTDNGTETAKCDICGETDTRIDGDSALGHNYKVDVTAPDCVNGGYTTHTCRRCDDSYVDSFVDALGHTEVVDAAVDPTCTETGLTKGKHCSVCNKVLVAQTVVDALGHTEVVDATVDPTCTETGLTEGKHCSVCNEVLVAQTVVDALGHTEVVDAAVDPTCTETGLTEGKHCSVCNKVLVAQTVVDELGHTEGMIEVVPSCTMTGLTGGRYCLVCHVIIIEPVVVDARGHSFTYYTSNSDATCTDNGTETAKCDICGETDTRIDGDSALGHNYKADVTAPDCVNGGYTIHTCRRCDDSYVDSFVDALGHTEVVDAAVDPTCTETGLTEGKHCSVCNEVLIAQTVVDALDHTAGETVVENNVAPDCTNTGSYDNVVYCTVCDTELCRETVTVNALGHIEVVDVAVAPTCTTAGLTEGKHCSVCNKVLVAQTVVDALGHTTGETVVENNVAPDCTNTGSYDNVVYCTVCQEELSRETVTVNALGHTEVIDAAVDPTCTETGLTEGKHCSVCNEVLVAQTVVDALGHTTGETVVENNVAPDCTNTGSYDNVVYCTVCDTELCRETVTVNALGHIEVVDVAVAPTCTTAGLTEGKHCSVCNEVLVAQTVVDALGHEYGEWIEVISPTYEVIGIERKYCNNCDHYESKDIAPLGYLQAFIDAVAGLSNDQATETTYNELYAALKLYAKLTDDEKQEADEEFLVLQAAINAYNSKAEMANTELKNATEIAFIPISASFTFLAALWLLLKKKFWI